MDSRAPVSPTSRAVAAVLARNATAARVDLIRGVFEAAPAGPSGAAERRAAAQLLLFLEPPSSSSASRSTAAANAFPDTDEQLLAALTAHHRRVADEEQRRCDALADRALVATAVSLGIAQLGPAVGAAAPLPRSTATGNHHHVQQRTTSAAHRGGRGGTAGRGAVSGRVGGGRGR